MEIVITIKVNGEDIKVTTETKEEVIDTMERKLDESGVSQYAVWFDENSRVWEKDSEYNKMFLTQQQRYANDLLRVRGHLFLNEVYDMLGIPKTKYGQIVGWFYDEKNSIVDNYVDFGLKARRNADFINGKVNKVLLDFNVDGNILDLI